MTLDTHGDSCRWNDSRRAQNLQPTTQNFWFLLTPCFTLMRRRQFLSAVALLPALDPTALWASRITRSTDPRIEEFDFTTLSSSITPEGDFYIRDHFPAPRVASRSWRLRISGNVLSPLEVTYADILRQPARKIVATLECAGNAVGAGGVSTAEWTGIPLGKLLQQAGLPRGEADSTDRGRWQRGTGLLLTQHSLGEGPASRHASGFPDERRSTAPGTWLPGAGGCPGMVRHGLRQVAGSN